MKKTVYCDEIFGLLLFSTYFSLPIKLYRDRNVMKLQKQTN